MGDRERRVGLNESLFREVNERLRDLSRASTSVDERLDLVCECAEATCAAHIAMSPEAYERMRADARRFVVVPGHELGSELELVVEQVDGYFVIEKLGEPARTAELTDPRGAGPGPA